MRRHRLLATAGRRRRRRHRRGRSGRRTRRAPPRSPGRRAQQGVAEDARRSTRRGASPSSCPKPTTPSRRTSPTRWPPARGCATRRRSPRSSPTGTRAVAELVNDGARFDESAPGEWSLTREGGHSRRRIIHAGGDATGAEVQRALDRAAATLDIRRNHVALQVLQHDGAVTGVLVRNDDGLGMVHAPSVILATGGLGHLYSATTNPEGSTGDGIALALWAGVAVSDIEFIQFHPTMLFDGHAGGRRPLITEAIRGEGAVLVDARGDSVTAGVHPMGDLAPRDVVAAAIDARLTDTGDQCVYLDARALDGFARRFPDGDRGVPGGRDRSDPATDSGGSRGALQLRRRRHRRARAHGAVRVVRGGGGGAHGHARREPARLQQPARRSGGGQSRGCRRRSARGRRGYRALR